MPGKTLFKIKNRDQLENRKKQLEFFLRECAKRKDIESNSSFKAFLEIDKHSPDLTYNAPSIVYENNELPQGVRDFHFFVEANIIYIACCDMKIASRLDAYVTNVNLPWEKKTDAHISVGSVFAFRVVQDKKGNPHVYEKIWAKSFPEQTGVVNFDKESCMLQVGLDSGTVIFYRTTQEGRFLDYEEVCKIKPHTARVMGLAFDSKPGYIYSCGSDNKFMLSEINYLSNITEVAQSNAGYTNLEKKDSGITKKEVSQMIESYINSINFRKISEKVAVQVSSCERTALELEREVEKIAKVDYMSDKAGMDFDGIISGITANGLYVELDNTVEGFVRYDTLTGFFIYDEKNYRAVNRGSGISLGLGDPVRIKVMAVDKVAKLIDFNIVQIKQ